jgi:hypothetical protein
MLAWSEGAPSDGLSFIEGHDACGLILKDEHFHCFFITVIEFTFGKITLAPSIIHTPAIPACALAAEQLLEFEPIRFIQWLESEPI